MAMPNGQVCAILFFLLCAMGPLVKARDGGGFCSFYYDTNKDKVVVYEHGVSGGNPCVELCRSANSFPVPTYCNHFDFNCKLSGSPGNFRLTGTCPDQNGNRVNVDRQRPPPESYEDSIEHPHQPPPHWPRERPQQSFEDWDDNAASDMANVNMAFLLMFGFIGHLFGLIRGDGIVPMGFI